MGMVRLILHARNVRSTTDWYRRAGAEDRGQTLMFLGVEFAVRDIAVRGGSTQWTGELPTVLVVQVEDPEATAAKLERDGVGVFDHRPGSVWGIERAGDDGWFEIVDPDGQRWQFEDDRRV